MNKQKLQSVARKLLIVVLIITAMLLLRETGYYTGLKERLFPAGGEHQPMAGTELAGSTKPAGAAQPLAVMVCGADGGRFGAAHNEENVMAVFRRFSADFGEALGSAGGLESISEEDFLHYLGSCGVFLRFYCPQPLELLSSWLGAEMNSDAASREAQLLCLCTDPSGVILCFGTGTGEFFRCTTAVSRDGLCSRTAEYVPNGAAYAFENKLLDGGDGYAVILEDWVSAAIVKRSVPLLTDTETDELLQTMGMNSYVVSSYSEADGTVVFVEDETTLRLGPDGSLFFHRPAMDAVQNSRSVSTAVSTAWQIAEQSIGRTCGDASLLLADVAYNESQRTFTVWLDYIVDGIPVRLGSGHAVEIVLRGDTVIQARLQFCSCMLTEEREVLLPGLQAAAIAAAEGAAAELAYVSNGETMNCVWVKSDG